MKKIVISIGNPLRSDDNIGNLVLDTLEKMNMGEEFHFIKAETNPENFIHFVKAMKPDIIIFLDAIVFNGRIGDVKVFKLEDVKSAITSTHTLSLNLFKEFVPGARIFLVGIKPKSLKHGTELSNEMKNKFKKVVNKVVSLLNSLT